MDAYIIWYGGASYAYGGVETAEKVGSLNEAKAICERRYRNMDGDTPCVDTTSDAFYYKYDPREVEDAYPDYVIKMGKRGGWVHVPA